MRLHALTTAAALVLLLGSCGGGGITTPQPPPPAPSATTPAATPTPTSGGARPTIVVSSPQGDVSKASPYAVNFDLCQSRDSAGVTSSVNLAYSADFDEGQGLVDQSGCGFHHDFKSSGADQFNVKLRATDKSTGGVDEATRAVRVFAPIKLTLGPHDTCPLKIVAEAEVQRGAVAAQGAITRMFFQARQEGGGTDQKEGVSKDGGRTWAAENWVTKFTKNEPVTVTATASSGNITGDSQEASQRPGCP